MDVGQGDGTVIITPLGQVVMIDDGVFTNPGAPVKQLADLGLKHVDLHFASHYHADHIGAISQIVKSGVVVEQGWDRGAAYRGQTFSTYVETLGDRRHTLAKGQVFTLDEKAAHPVTIQCVDLNGAGIASDDENAMSVSLRVSYGEFHESFCGDLTGNVERVVGPEMGPVEVYKVNHHGSRDSSTDAWLDALKPEIAVIQCGNGNTYGHPTPEALDRLHAHQVRTYWTETGGGAKPDPKWDHVAGGWVIIEATWEPGGSDTVRGNGFEDTFTNSGR